MATNPLNADAVFQSLMTEEEKNPNSFNRKKKSGKVNESRGSGKGPKRITKTLNEYKDPEQSTDPDEQIQLIAEGLSQKISEGNSLSATMFARDWVNGIVDGSGNLYEPVLEELSTLPKADLLKFIGGLLGSIK